MNLSLCYRYNLHVDVLFRASSFEVHHGLEARPPYLDSCPGHPVVMPPYNFFHDILTDYQNNRFCDLALCGSPGDASVEPILCHKLILCALVRDWRHVIDEDTDRVTWPDIEHVRLKAFVDRLYHSLTNHDESWRDWQTQVSAVFGPGAPVGVKTVANGVLTALSEACQPEHPNHEENKETLTEVIMEMDVDFQEDQAINLFDESKVESQDDGDNDDDFEEDTFQVNSDQNEIDEDDWEGRLDHDQIVVDEDSQATRSASKDIDNKRARPSVKDARRKKMLAQNQAMMQSDSVDKVIDHQPIQELLKSQSDGILRVDVTCPPMESKIFVGKGLTKQEEAFFALVGVQQINGELRGQSLAWTTEDSRVIDEVFQPTLIAFQSVFGLSRALLMGSSCFRSYAGKGSQTKGPNYVNDLRRKFLYQCTRNDLENELNSQPVVEANAISEATRREISLPEGDYTIRMSEILSSFDDIVLVGVYKHGVEVRQVHYSPGLNRNYVALTVCRLLTLVWVGGNHQARFPKSPKVVHLNKEHTRLKYIEFMAKKLLASDEELPIPLPLVTCEICGKQIQETIFMNNMTFHKQKHALEKIQCGCDIKFRSLTHKHRHFDEHHRDKILKQFGSLKNPLGSKIKRKRKKERGAHVCDTCGKVLGSVNTLKDHINRTHNKFHCNHCKIDFPSAKKFKRHWTQAHPDSDMELPDGWFSCDQCPQRFQEKIYVQRHWELVHGTEEDKAYKCGLCQKNFSEKPKLKYHMLNIHIKSRPYNCRSPGCTSTFNYCGNLYAHEKKLHGRALGKATSIDIVIPDSQLLELGCKLKPPIQKMF
ncbi:hypothetical protein TCAL_05055 [Tigriopus californicus]|uniref:C2H2-type domain-containing protein n=2 Tax=Tigriopus californicus TaxID=6832 RepID=A0A553P718_TIGCA|nr:hypothetical protein TCAL_05055 [Tigriopus californicus]